MKIMLLAAILVAGSVPATAQTPGPPPAAAPPLCTTTTVVVRRGDTMVSTTSTTKCGDEQSGAGFHPAEVLASSGQAVDTLLAGQGSTATPRNVRGDWHAVQPSADRVCHVFLTSQADAGGYHVRVSDCTGDLAGASDWKFEDGSVALYSSAGALIGRLLGDRDQLVGSTAAGQRVVLAR